MKVANKNGLWKIGRTGEKSNAWKHGDPKCLICGKQLKNYYAKYCLNHRFIGERHPKWKGDNVGYFALHDWVYRTLGKPIKCEFCGSTKQVQWANKSHEYKRNVSDWIQLCQSCHYYYDNMGEKRWKNHIKKGMTI